MNTRHMQRGVKKKADGAWTDTSAKSRWSMSQWNGEPGLHRVMEATLEFEAGALGSKKNSSSGAHSRGSSMTKPHQEAPKTWRFLSAGMCSRLDDEEES